MAPPSKADSATLAALTALELTFINAGRLLLLPVFFICIAAGLSQFTDAKSHAAIRRFLSAEAAFEQPLTTAVKRVAPTRLQGKDISRWIVVLLIYLVSVSLGWTGSAFAVQAAAIRERRAARGEALEISSDLGREKLLEIYTQAKLTLDERKRPLAFLSIDVVDSTGLKVGEDPGVAERDFKQYKRLVEKVVQSHHSLKSAWTPDGVMICFKDAATAVDAAADLLSELRDFNTNVKAIKRDFAIRIGVNAGPVLYDEETPMEEMSDRVIDIAGHFQKYGTVNAVSVPKAIAESLGDARKFTSSGRIVDQLELYEWRPEKS